MKTPLFSLSAVCIGLSVLLSPSVSRADDLTPPVVVNALPNLTVPVGTSQSAVKLKKVFGLSGVTGEVVRFSTTVGDVDVELLSGSAPSTVATFLTYANNSSDNTSSNYSYKDTLIQRAISGFIVQGGGFYVDSSKGVDQIEGRPSIKSEAGVKNTRGTLAMALSTGPDSATGDFFFNVADNAMLDDTSDGGPFTVFGRVVGSLATLDAITALPNENFSSLGGAFANVPVVNYDPSVGASAANLVYLNTITPIQTVPTAANSTALLSFKVKNSNPDLVTATITAKKLTLVYTPGKTGTATITVKAFDTAGTKAKSAFTVTVQ